MWKDIIKDPKLLATAGMTVVALVLVYVLLQSNLRFADATRDMNEAVRENTIATTESVEASRSLQALILESLGEKQFNKRLEEVKDLTRNE